MGCCSGVPLDALFTFSTGQIVKIRDRRLGMLYYMLVICIFCYIVVFSVFYKNSQFFRRDVQGTSRITIQQPTVKGCNPNKPSCQSSFRSFIDLPYCAEYQGQLPAAAEQRKCIYADAHTLQPEGMLNNFMLVPTYLKRRTLSRGCHPSQANNFTCSNEFNVQGEPETFFVADIERYTIMVIHSYQRLDMIGSNVELPGYVSECKSDISTRAYLTDRAKCTSGWELKPIECLTKDCYFAHDDVLMRDTALAMRLDKHVRSTSFLQNDASMLRSGTAHSASAAQVDELELGYSLPSGPPDSKTARLLTKGVFAIKHGDIFRISSLLELAGVSLDETRNHAGDTARLSGTAIYIKIVYDNLVPWLSSFGYMPVRYHYEVKLQPMDEFKNERVVHESADTRVVESRHGLYVRVTLSGAFGFFSFIQLSIILTSGVGLVGLADFLTRSIAMYGMHNRGELSRLMIKERTPSGAAEDEERTPSGGAEDVGSDIQARSHA